MTSNFTTKNDGITYYFSKSVKPESQKTIQNTLSEVREKSWKNKDFFDNLNIDAYGSWDEYPDKYIPYYTVGFTKDPAIAGEKRIRLRTNNSFKKSLEYYFKFDIEALFNRKIKLEILKDYLLHELGHLFNHNFANPDKELAENVKSLNDKDIYSLSLAEVQEYIDLHEKYFKQNELSDSEEFKEAWKRDLHIAFKGKSNNENEILLDQLGYFSPKYFDESSHDDEESNEIILEDGINEEEMEIGGKARSEIFAQLFAYANGSCDDESSKHLIVNTYKHSYEVVKKYINEYLGTNTKGHYVPRTQNKLDCTM